MYLRLRHSLSVSMRYKVASEQHQTLVLQNADVGLPCYRPHFRLNAETPQSQHATDPANPMIWRVGLCPA